MTRKPLALWEEAPCIPTVLAPRAPSAATVCRLARLGPRQMAEQLPPPRSLGPVRTPAGSTGSDREGLWLPGPSLAPSTHFSGGQEGLLATFVPGPQRFGGECGVADKL